MSSRNIIKIFLPVLLGALVGIFLFSVWKQYHVENIVNLSGDRERPSIGERIDPGNIVPEKMFPERSVHSIKILFGGDMMFDREIRRKADKSGYDSIFKDLEGTFSAADISMANLEGPITSQSSKSLGSKMGEARNYVFTFDPAVAPTLRRNHISIVNLGNNHILNFGKDGLTETKKYLEDAGVEYFGDPFDTSHRWLLKELNGVKVAFVNYNHFATGGRESAFEDIKQARSSADIVIVYTHWGNEYVPANNMQKQLAHEFIDAGADAVIGSHPHVVQESEEYKGKKIYYSLGNLVFDQYFSSETQQGLLLEMAFDIETKAISFREIAIRTEHDGRTVMEKRGLD